MQKIMVHIDCLESVLWPVLTWPKKISLGQGITFEFNPNMIYEG